MIVDVHAHYTPKNFSEFMGDRFASPVHLPVKRAEWRAIRSRIRRRTFKGGSN